MKKVKLPFGWALYVSICNEEELNKDTKKLELNFKFNKEDKVNGIAEFVYKKSPNESFFIVWANNSRSEHLYFLLHEIHHITHMYSKHLEIEDEEFRAYVFEDICKQLKLMDSHKNKIK